MPSGSWSLGNLGENYGNNTRKNSVDVLGTIRRPKPCGW
jgi:hypothetical protein